MGAKAYCYIWRRPCQGHTIRRFASILLFNSCQPVAIITEYRWGQSAGGISIGSQLVTNQGDNEGLFRGVIMQSGSPQTTVNSSRGHPNFVGPGWERGPGSRPHRYEVSGRVSIDFLLSHSEGNVDDEGTLFSLAVTNITYGRLSPSRYSTDWIYFQHGCSRQRIRF